MPDEAPAAPEGCVYGPWWDAQSNSWLCIKKREDGSLVMLWKNHMVENWQRCPDRDGYQELLRVAAERDELRAENERLKAENQRLAEEIHEINERLRPIAIMVKSVTEEKTRLERSMQRIKNCFISKKQLYTTPSKTLELIEAFVNDALKEAGNG